MDLTNLITGLGIVAIVLLACGVIAVAVLVNAWASIKRELLGKKDEREVTFAQHPIEVRASVQFATKEELADVKRDIDEMRQQLTRNKDEILHAGTARASAIYEHIDEVRRELSEKQDALPNQIIATLKNTGAIG